MWCKAVWCDGLVCGAGGVMWSGERLIHMNHIRVLCSQKDEAE